MIDFTKAKSAFETYLDGYDRTDDKINLKIIHTYGVIHYASMLADRLKLSKEERKLAEITALLHDIGRFEQLRRFDSFQPDTMDHAAYGVKILFEEGMIRQFTEDPSKDHVIRDAIAQHSLYKLGNIGDPQTLLHARLIRDADKLDNCRVKLEESIETLLGASPYEVGQTAISPHIGDTFFNNECIRSLDRITKMDHWISYIAYFYDINFPESLSVIDNEHFVSRILHRIPYSNKETEAMIEKMEEHMNNYIRTGVTTYDENINH